ncbi:AAA family ATPase [Microbacterium sp. MPKO10]|uniref:nucleotide-binding protein n=1 Tax=Microbacterium sp. MPKO10 TaxID=2989818 RepID=UPI0022359660|nr:AAA family ATPase [Microbacterium sp. MPKO10]MCW4459386.1 AAA family ATPase [Microbacterium sp. MPKO10]
MPSTHDGTDSALTATDLAATTEKAQMRSQTQTISVTIPTAQDDELDDDDVVLDDVASDSEFALTSPVEASAAQVPVSEADDDRDVTTDAGDEAALTATSRSTPTQTPAPTSSSSATPSPKESERSPSVTKGEKPSPSPSDPSKPVAPKSGTSKSGASKSGQSTSDSPKSDDPRGQQPKEQAATSQSSQSKAAESGTSKAQASKAQPSTAKKSKSQASTSKSAKARSTASTSARAASSATQASPSEPAQADASTSEDVQTGRQQPSTSPKTGSARQASTERTSSTASPRAEGQARPQASGSSASARASQTASSTEATPTDSPSRFGASPQPSKRSGQPGAQASVQSSVRTPSESSSADTGALKSRGTSTVPASTTLSATSGLSAASTAIPNSSAGSADAQPTPQSVSARRAPNSGAENADMLTAERLLDDRSSRGRAPEDGVQRLLYQVSGHLINLGDSKKTRKRKDLTHRIAKPFAGSARFVPVLTRKGGVGKTTVSILLGMALADARDDRVIAVDANPDHGTLHDRLRGNSDYTVRDVIHRAADVAGFTEFSTLVARDETRLDVLASDPDPAVTKAFDDSDYRVVAELAAQYYSMVLTDSGTGMVHDVMGETLEKADGCVIVSGTSVDEARATSETISWLESNGHGALAKNAVVVINNRSAARSMVKLDELEAHFASRVRAVARVPYDPMLASGAPIDFRALRPATRQAARLLAASVVDGLPTQRPTIPVY